MERMVNDVKNRHVVNVDAGSGDSSVRACLVRLLSAAYHFSALMSVREPQARRALSGWSSPVFA